MKLIQLIILPAFHRRTALSFLLFLCTVFSWAQSPKEIRSGVSLSMEIEKDLNRFFSLTGEEEVRLIDNNTDFDRTVTSLGIDYALFNRKVKIGAYYAFLYLYNNDYFFEPRHRYYFNLSYKETFGSLILSWRGRIQGTYRNERLGEYKINPKYVMKNKWEVAYLLWGSPWKPYFSCDLSTNLNDPVRGYELTRVRFEGGATWRLNRTDYVGFFLRLDEYPVGDEPQIASIGASYKIKF
jgi:hypothetical protein